MKWFVDGYILNVHFVYDALSDTLTFDGDNAIASRSIDSDNKEKDISEKNISARDDIEKTMKSFFGNIWDNLYQNEQSS